MRCECVNFYRSGIDKLIGTVYSAVNAVSGYPESSLSGATLVSIV